MTSCQTCPASTTATPALCGACRTERARHGRAKAASRWTVLVARLEKRRWTELEPRVAALESRVAVLEAGTRGRAGSW